MNIFENYLKKRKWFLIALLVLTCFIGFVFKFFQLEESASNFVLFYIVTPIAFALVYLRIEKHRKRNG